MPSIEVNMDWVVVEGVRVQRPARMGRGQWLDFWEFAWEEWEL